MAKNDRVRKYIEAGSKIQKNNVNIFGIRKRSIYKIIQRSIMTKEIYRERKISRKTGKIVGFFTEEEVEILKNNYEDGRSHIDISRILNRNVGCAVSHKNDDQLFFRIHSQKKMVVCVVNTQYFRTHF